MDKADHVAAAPPEMQPVMAAAREVIEGQFRG